jgi:hypothetical protein
MSASDQDSLYEKLQCLAPGTQAAVQQIIFAAGKRLLHYLVPIWGRRL